MRSTIENLMYPSRTVMDLVCGSLLVSASRQLTVFQSLAMALYFASRGQGTIHNDSTGTDEEYTSPARVLLSGLGSDELLGGYSRHRVAFRNNGWKGLTDEVGWINIPVLLDSVSLISDILTSSNSTSTVYHPVT